MKTEILNVNGMSCKHCVNAVDSELKELSGIESVNISLESGTVEVSFDESKVSLDDIKKTISETGYEVA